MKPNLEQKWGGGEGPSPPSPLYASAINSFVLLNRSCMKREIYREKIEGRKKKCMFFLRFLISILINSHLFSIQEPDRSGKTWTLTGREAEALHAEEEDADDNSDDDIQKIIQSRYFLYKITRLSSCVRARVCFRREATFYYWITLFVHLFLRYASFTFNQPFHYRD